MVCIPLLSTERNSELAL
jgi:hypothetical protein